MKYLYKLIYLATVFIYFVSSALPVPPPPGGGGGGTTPGAPASPIDDYVIYLAITATIIIYFTYKKYLKIVKN